MQFCMLKLMKHVNGSIITVENLQYLDTHTAPPSLICGYAKPLVENGCNER